MILFVFKLYFNNYDIIYIYKKWKNGKKLSKMN